MVERQFGHYRILGNIGEGGMGAVYRARDERLDRIVAIKLVKELAAEDETARARLLQEARLASALNHPHICTIYEVGEADGQAYIAMEHVEGQPLSGSIPSTGFPADTIFRLGSQIADALAHAHERAVIHRDLKTSNMVLTAEGRVKVLDFGLARRLPREEAEDATLSHAPLTREGTLVGTLHYLAPELLRGAPADVRSDIWALGVVLYEMAAGSLPFVGQTAYELSAAILERPAVPLPARVHAGLGAVIRRCLAKDPAQRFQRAGEVRAALEILDLAQHAADPASGPPHPPIATPSGPPPAAGPKRSDIPEANEYVEKGMMFMQGLLDLVRARRMLERAIELDPHFCLARAAYGFTYILMIETGESNNPSLIYKAEEELRRALLDDPACSFARGALAAVYFQQGRKELAPRELAQALELDPESVPARMWSMMYELSCGDFGLAQETGRKMLESRPTFWPARLYCGEVFRQQGKLAEAEREQGKVLEQDPANAMALLHLARAYMDRGNLTQARETLEGGHPHARQNYRLRLGWSLLLALEGKEADALREMDPEVQRYAEVHVLSTAEAAAVYAVLGDRGRALAWLDRAVRNGDERGDYFRRNPMLASLHEDAGFRQILSSIEFRRQG